MVYAQDFQLDEFVPHHGLLAQFKGWRFALCPATSQFTGLFDQVNFQFSYFFSMDNESNSKAFKIPFP